MEAQGLLPHVDELVMEYLLFRGFTKSFQAFASERRRDRARGFDADQILSQLLLAIQSYQVESVLETWKFLSARFFHHLDASYSSTLQKLETSLLRLYVVNAVKTGHREKAAEFFKRFANRLHATIPPRDGDGGDSWARWFVLPFIERPEADPYFRVFFSREWLEAFVTSFRNFLSLVFRSLPLPKLLAFQLSRLHDPTLKMRLRVSQAECSRLRALNVEAGNKVKALEDAGRQLHSILRMMVQHNFLEHFSDSSGSPPGDEPSDAVESGKGAPRHRIQHQSSHLGLSRDQMREIGELFGVSSRDNAATAALFDGENERALGSDELLSEEERPSEVASAPESDPGDELSPPFSPVAGMDPLGVLEPHAELPDDGGDSDGGSGRPSEFWDASAAGPKRDGDDDRSLKVSLIRELDMLHDWKENASVMSMRSRFTRDGEHLAIAQVGNSYVDIWRAEGGDPSSLLTLSLHYELTHLDWINTNHSEQAMLCGLSNHSISMWRIRNGELLSSLPAISGARIVQLASAKNGSIAICLYEHDPYGGSSVQDLRILEANEGELTSRTAISGVSGTSCVAVSDCGRIIALATARGQFRFLDPRNSSRVVDWTLDSEQVGDGSAPPVLAMCFSPDSASVYSTHALTHEVLEWGVGDVKARLFSQSTIPADGDNHPPIVCRYDLGIDGVSLDDAQGRVNIRFLGGGDFFSVSYGDRLQLFKRGRSRPLDIGNLDQDSLADLDWHPALPMSSTASHDGAVALWEIEELSGAARLKEIGI